MAPFRFGLQRYDVFSRAFEKLSKFGRFVTQENQFTMNRILSITAAVLTTTLFFSCIPETAVPKTPETVSIEYSDDVIKKILELQDKQDSTALYPYFRSAQANYRYAAAQAFAAIKSGQAIDSLEILLEDNVEEVRTAAAYAIGQSGIARGAEILKRHFRGKDSADVNSVYNATVLEGVGKTGSLEDLKLLATVKSYRDSDSLLLLGQVRAIFYMSLRKIIADEGTEKMVQFLNGRSTSDEIRMLAAHYFARNKQISISPYRLILSTVISREKNPEVTAQLATAFGNSKDSLFLPVLRKTLAESKDDRVKIHALKALGNFSYQSIRQELLSFLKDKIIYVASAAAGVLLYNGSTDDVPLYQAYDTTNVHWWLRSRMCGAVLVHTPLYLTKTKGEFSQKLLKTMNASTSPYMKAAFIDALSRDAFNYPLLVKVFRENKHPVVRIAALEGLARIVKSPSFYLALGKDLKTVRAVIFKTLSQAIEEKDPGLVAVASGILKDPAGNWQGWMKNRKVWQEVLQGLKLPEMIESYNALEELLAYAENRPPVLKTPDYNHPMDWTLFQTIGDTSMISVKTTRGNILLELYKRQAPASVCNFIGLLREGFFNGRVFHRIVPNFVIQTGCPRGDGYGSLDYSIRSELPQCYYNRSGLVGMASAGRHTEGTQWFITHSATPHLDGRYTLFGRVTDGMDVVNSMEQGDKIVEVLLIK